MKTLTEFTIKVLTGNDSARTEQEIRNALAAVGLQADITVEELEVPK